MSNNGPILDLVAKGKLDEDLIDIKNESSIFNYDNDVDKHIIWKIIIDEDMFAIFNCHPKCSTK